MKSYHLPISARPDESAIPGSHLESVHKDRGSLADRRRGPAARILIADDHALMLSVTAELLGRHYHVVGTVRDGQAVLDAIGKLSPDVAVVDIGMPRLHGVEVANRIRNLGFRTRLVFLTVYQDAEFVRTALSAGVLGYVVKSYLMNDLPLAVRAALLGQQFLSPCLQDVLSSPPRHLLRLPTTSPPEA